MENWLKTCISLLAGVTLLSITGCAGSMAISPTPTPIPTPTPTPGPQGAWTWVSGSNVVNASGIYGTEGVAAPGNTPGARTNEVGWTDKNGNFWLFGGLGIDSTGKGADLNDLWKYSGGQWTWMGGPNLINQPGVYGTKGVASADNIPGGRQHAVSWTDADGNLWLFGGLGIDSTGTGGDLNDLWKYNPGSNTWTWISGSNIAQTGITGSYSVTGVYGTEGVAAPGNVPGPRWDAVSWRDSSGNFWLFGGGGWDSTEIGVLNDLWKYSPTTNMWTWVSGPNTVDHNGVYGTQGAAAPGNIPGSRTGSVGWTDASGSLWLFGGDGADANGARCQETGPPCELNDLWKYNIASNMWTWMGGPNLNNEPGVYGTEGVASAGNLPWSRDSVAASWTDAAGNFWLFGGITYVVDLNDLWKYDPTTNMWTWMSGSDNSCPGGAYGTQGVAASGNVPGGRNNGVGWTDKSGNLWFFGGEDSFCNGANVYNDLWEYQP